MRRAFAIALAVAVGLSGSVFAGELDLSGSVGGEARGFFDDAAYPGQLDDWQLSWVGESELRWRSEDRRHQFTVAAFGRLDQEDDERTHFDLREAYYRYIGDGWELLVGANRVFWGVTESRHLVDIVNQSDAVETIDNEDKLGQPMVHMAWDRDYGRFELLALVGFRERTFPGTEGRLRPPWVVDTDSAGFESSAGSDRIDVAARWSHYIGDWDVGVHLFHGTSREPGFVPLAVDRVSPQYDLINQLGVDLQYTRGAWLWKLEALAREGQGESFGALVAGFERTFYQLGDSAVDLGFLLELHHDGRDPMAPPTLYDDDLFLGGRLAFNDSQDSALLMGVLIDEEDRSMAALIEAGRRLGSSLTLELEGRFFLDVDPSGELGFLAADDLLSLRVAWNF